MDQKKLNKLIKFYKKRLKEEEKLYNIKLTELDSAVTNIINERSPEAIDQLKDSLNRIYRASEGMMGNPKLPLFIRKIIHKICHVILGPYFERQNEFNSQIVHLINESIAQLETYRKREQLAFGAIIQFDQRIIALMDVKELNAGHRNFKMLLEMQNQIMNDIDRLKETLMIAYEGIDRRLLSFMAQQLETKQRLDTLKAEETEKIITPEKAAIDFNINRKETDEFYALYVAFENRYRGPEELIKKRLAKYADMVGTEGKILDIGCGRGEFLELVKERGLEGYGIDINVEMVKRCEEKKLEVLQEDALEHLIKLKEESIGTILCTHVIEHILHYKWYEMLILCRRALMPNGKLIIETLNPRSFYGVIEYYFKDPTHRNLMYPEYLHYLLEILGFKNVWLGYSSPVESSIALIDVMKHEPEINENFSRLNKFLFDSIEYHMVSHK